MAGLIAKSNVNAVIGMGITGLSLARYLQRKAIPFVMFDTRENPAGLEDFRAQFPTLSCELGEMNAQSLMQFERIIVSPGVPLSEPAIVAAMDAGIPVIGDIDLFAKEALAPIAAITGSNAKTTVTTLLGDMALAAGLNVGVGGNIGRPVLDLLEDGPVDLYVLELSSFQLETVQELNASVATVLNISADHMDRYADLPAYVMAKQRIYFAAKNVVVNREDTLTQPPMASGVTTYSFGLDRADRHGFGLLKREGVEHLAYEFKPLMPLSELKMPGRHNVANALAALALGHALELPMDVMLSKLKTFPGLEHRCQWVRSLDGVEYFNDSKGTNIGATQAALAGLSKDPANIILIAGGVGKGADFTSLRKEVNAHVKHAVLFGRDAMDIESALADTATMHQASDLDSAVSMARGLASSGDTVLLSPACASFDMFSGFEQRGQAFVSAVEALQ